MSKTLQWIIGIGVILIVVAVIFSTVWPFFAPRTGWNGYGMMGPGHMYGGGGMTLAPALRSGASAGVGGMGFGMPFFGIGMFVLPLLFVGLIVLGVVWLVRSVAAPGAPQPPASGVFCSHCGKPLQVGWKACPYCGEKV